MMNAANRCRVPLEAVLDYVDGRGDAANRARVQNHLDAGCSRCAPQVAKLQKLLPEIREAYRYSAPDSVVERAKAIHGELFRRPNQVSLIARLVGDSRRDLALAGARGAERSGIRTAYATDDHDVDLWQERESGSGSRAGWYLIGQAVLRTSAAAVTPEDAQLTAESGATTVATAEDGEFHFADVSMGRYTIRLTLPGQEIILPDVLVGE